MRSGRFSVLALVLGGALTSGLGGCEYDPHPVDGTLRCSMSGACPEGYECQASGTCWAKKGGTPSNDIEAYVGEWLLGVTANVKTVCDDGFSETGLLSPASNPSTMTVSRSGTGLVSVWLCELTLRWDASGAHLNDPSPSCVDDTADPVYTWTATTFELVTSNGLTGQHNATYTRKDEYVDGTIVNCNQTVTAPLLKQ